MPRSSFIAVLIPPVFLFENKVKRHLNARFSLFSKVLPPSEHISNEVKARRGLTLRSPFRTRCEAGTWDRHLRQDCQRAEKLSTRQTQGNEFSPGSTRRLSAWMTMESDKDKCHYHHQRHYCIRNTNCYKSLKSPVGGICNSLPLFSGELT